MLRRTSLALTLLLFLSSALAPSSHAQRADTSGALPDIAPREVEIRGQLEISLPSLERQPLTGFNPPPRVPGLPPDHRPFVETYRQDTRTLAGGLPEQDDMPRLVQPAAEARGEIEGGVGRYFSRFGRLVSSLPVSDHERLALDLGYEGVSSYAPYPDEEIETPYDTFQGSFGLTSHRARVASGFTFGGFADAYTLYGARLAPSGPTAGLAAQPDRQGRGGFGEAWLRTQEAAPLPLEVRLRYEESLYETALQPDDDARAINERQLIAAVEVRPPIGRGGIVLDGRAALSGMDANSPGTDGVAGELGLAASLRTDAAYTLRAGVRAMGYRTSTLRRGEDADQRRAYVFPSLRLDFPLADGAQVYAENTPGVKAHTLSDLFSENPFLVAHPALQPTVRLVDAEGGLRLTAGAIQFLARGGYEYMPSHLFFEAADAPSAFDRGFFAVRYEPAQVIHGGLVVTLPSYRGVDASVGFSLREGTLTEDETVIPYFAPATAHALLSYAFPRDRGALRATATFESPRPLDRDDEAEAPAFFDLDVEGSYRVAPAVSVVVRLENLSDALERWDGYPQPPMLVGAGARIHF